MNTKIGKLIVELYNSGILLKYDGNLKMDRKIGGLKPTKEYNQLVLSFTENDYVSIVFDEKYRLLAHNSELGDLMTMEYFPDIFGLEMLMNDIEGLLDDTYTSLGFVELKKHVWVKKKEHISEAEYEDSNYLYNLNGNLRLMPFAIKTKNEITGEYEFSDKEFSKYLLTSEELQQRLPSTYHMFEPTVVKVPTDSLYGEIKGNKE